MMMKTIRRPNKGVVYGVNFVVGGDWDYMEIKRTNHPKRIYYLTNETRWKRAHLLLGLFKKMWQ
jgi:hypothetical protein